MSPQSLRVRLEGLMFQVLGPQETMVNRAFGLLGAAGFELMLAPRLQESLQELKPEQGQFRKVCAYAKPTRYARIPSGRL